MSRSTDTWCWMCGDPINCHVERADRNNSCPFGPGLQAGERLQRERVASEERLRQIVCEEVARAIRQTAE